MSEGLSTEPLSKRYATVDGKRMAYLSLIHI